ncbi:hypothetical protein JOQ06_019741 [Pogonophryne albipinna]|uniref:Integrase core domain-containing protein n=1 Tax=Pogonophryne albipinna TaxID=1090488 RepID=A0AAD6BPR3_9TELE|nr:hypothetical protein JOQ06_019741 [Pogonophryne albipinna]
MPHAGYRLVKGTLQSRGFRVQWERVRASMHRAYTVGILFRMNQLGYNIVIFGGIDGFSRKIMFLGAANNNLASTALAFFQKSVDRYGFPLRYQLL